MNRIFLFFLPANDTTLIVPGQSVGPVTLRFTGGDLVKGFGAVNVKNAKLALAESPKPGVEKRLVALIRYPQLIDKVARGYISIARRGNGRGSRRSQGPKCNIR